MEENSNVTGMAEGVGPEAEYDDWDDIDISDVGDGEEAAQDGTETGNADQRQPEEDAEQAETTETEGQTAKQAEADQLFTLKHLDETRQVGRDEVIALAQKGMDYDRIREDRDQARAEMMKYSEMEAFLRELAEPNGMTIEELIDATRANVLAEKEGVDRDIAMQRVKLDRDRKALEAERQKLTRQTEAGRQAAAEQQRMRDSMDRFIQAHPELNAEDIPQEVWEAFAAGKDLGDAYAPIEAKLLREQLEEKDRELETLRQNKNNQARSTGSQASAGSQKDSERDELDRLWYDGT